MPADRGHIAAAVQTDVACGSPDLQMQTRFLASRGFQVTLICQNSGQSPLARWGERQFSYDAVPLVGLNGLLGKLVRHGWYAWKLLKARLHRPDLFYICEAPMCPGALLALVGVPARRVVYHAQNFTDPARHRVEAFLEHVMLRRAGLVVCNEPMRARLIRSSHGLAKQPLVVRTAMPGRWGRHADPAAVRRRLLPDRLGRLLMHLGPYGRARMGPQILAALARLPRSYSLLFTGGEPEPAAMAEMRSLARRLGVEQRLHFTGHLPFNDLPDYIAACDAGLLLYREEDLGHRFGTPGRLAQYAACGTPVVASDTPPLRRAIERYGLGATCRAASPADIAEAVRQVCELGQESRRERAERLRRAFRRHLAYEHDGRRLVAALERMLNGGLRRG